MLVATTGSGAPCLRLRYRSTRASDQGRAGVRIILLGQPHRLP